MSALDLDFVRGLYPAANWDWALFENAGGAVVPTSVVERLYAYMTQCQVQPRAPYGPSELAAERMDDGHRLMAAMIGAEMDEVVIGASTSINLYVLAQALLPLWSEGDQVIVTELNHEANSGPWRRLADRGIKIVEWPVDPESGALDVEGLDALLNERTRLVAFPHVSNITGDINDVAAVTTKAHDAGAMVCVDAVAYAPHRAVDVKAWDVDFYAFSFYKVFGPHMGCLYGKKDRLLEARGQYHYFIGEAATSAKLNPAGPQHEMMASLVGIADYFEALAAHHLSEPPNGLHDRVKAVFDLVAEQEERLADMFVDFAAAKPDVRLLGRRTAAAADRAPTFSFTVRGRASADLPALLAKDRLGISSGHFYAKRLVEALGVDDAEDGVVRCSMAHYNTVEEVQRLVDALDREL